MNNRCLFVDVQASGSPGNGFLLEVAWKESGLSSHCFLVRNTSGMNIPPRVKRITGITEEDVKGVEAIDPAELKKLFLAAAGRDGDGSPLVLVAHFAVYEKRWLDWLTGLNLDFLCTRELARKGISDLPSGTLRAVAGAVGFYLGEKRRARDHVQATEAVFLALRSEFIPISVTRKDRLSLSVSPGVYRFLDTGDNLLYIGKAKNLRVRVNSHFTGKQRGRHAELISRTSRVTVLETATALDAAIIESQLISEFSPQYNLAGKVHREALWYISGSLDRVTTEPEDLCFFGPFSTVHPVAELAELNSFIGIELNKLTFVENLWPNIPETLLIQALTEWKKETKKIGILQHGLMLHFLHGNVDRPQSEMETELVDVEYVKCKLNDLVVAGCLVCRKSAAHRLLQGCEIRWESSSSKEHVHKFVENSVTDNWNQRKLQISKVLLAEVRRIYREGKDPEIRTRFGTIIAGDSLGYLLSVV